MCCAIERDDRKAIAQALPLQFPGKELTALMRLIWQSLYSVTSCWGELDLAFGIHQNQWWRGSVCQHSVKREKFPWAWEGFGGANLGNLKRFLLENNFHANVSVTWGLRGCTEALSCETISDEDMQCYHRPELSWARVPTHGWGSFPKLLSQQWAAATSPLAAAAPAMGGDSLLSWKALGALELLTVLGSGANGALLCTCFASLPCPAEIVSRGRALHVQHRQAVSRKVKSPSAFLWS